MPSSDPVASNEPDGFHATQVMSHRRWADWCLQTMCSVTVVAAACDLRSVGVNGGTSQIRQVESPPPVARSEGTLELNAHGCTFCERRATKGQSPQPEHQHIAPTSWERGEELAEKTHRDGVSLQPNHTRIIGPNLPHAAHIKLFERTARRLCRTFGTSSSSSLALRAVRARMPVVSAAAAAARLVLDLVVEPVSLFPAAAAPARRRP